MEHDRTELAIRQEKRSEEKGRQQSLQGTEDSIGALSGVPAATSKAQAFGILTPAAAVCRLGALPTLDLLRTPRDLSGLSIRSYITTPRRSQHNGTEGHCFVSANPKYKDLGTRRIWARGERPT